MRAHLSRLLAAALGVSQAVLAPVSLIDDSRFARQVAKLENVLDEMQAYALSRLEDVDEMPDDELEMQDESQGEIEEADAVRSFLSLVSHPPAHAASCPAVQATQCRLARFQHGLFLDAALEADAMTSNFTSLTDQPTTHLLADAGLEFMSGGVAVRGGSQMQRVLGATGAGAGTARRLRVVDQQWDQLVRDGSVTDVEEPGEGAEEWEVGVAEGSSAELSAVNNKAKASNQGGRRRRRSSRRRRRSSRRRRRSSRRRRRTSRRRRRAKKTGTRRRRRTSRSRRRTSRRRRRTSRRRRRTSRRRRRTSRRRRRTSRRRRRTSRRRRRAKKTGTRRRRRTSRRRRRTSRRRRRAKKTGTRRRRRTSRRRRRTSRRRRRAKKTGTRRRRRTSRRRRRTSRRRRRAKKTGTRRRRRTSRRRRRTSRRRRRTSRRRRRAKKTGTRRRRRTSQRRRRTSRRRRRAKKTGTRRRRRTSRRRRRTSRRRRRAWKKTGTRRRRRTSRRRRRAWKKTGTRRRRRTSRRRSTRRKAAAGRRRWAPYKHMNKVAQKVFSDSQSILSTSVQHANEVLSNIDEAVVAMPTVKFVWDQYKVGLTALYNAGKCMDKGNFMCTLKTLTGHFDSAATTNRLKAFCRRVNGKKLRVLSHSQRRNLINTCVLAGAQGALMSAAGAEAELAKLQAKAHQLTRRGVKATRAAAMAAELSLSVHGSRRVTLQARARKLRLFADTAVRTATALTHQAAKVTKVRNGMKKLREQLARLQKVMKTMQAFLAKMKQMNKLRNHIAQYKTTVRILRKYQNTMRRAKARRKYVGHRVRALSSRCWSLSIQVRNSVTRVKAAKAHVARTQATKKRYDVQRVAALALLRKQQAGRKTARGWSWRARRARRVWNGRIRRTRSRLYYINRNRRNARSQVVRAQRSQRAQIRRLAGAKKRHALCTKRLARQRQALAAVDAVIRQTVANVRATQKKVLYVRGELGHDKRVRAAYQRLLKGQGLPKGVTGYKGFRTWWLKLAKQQAGNYQKIYHPWGHHHRGYIQSAANPPEWKGAHCLQQHGGHLRLVKCQRGSAQIWYFDKFSRLVSWQTKKCLIAPTTLSALTMGTCQQLPAHKFFTDALGRLRTLGAYDVCAAASTTSGTIKMVPCSSDYLLRWYFPVQV